MSIYERYLVYCICFSLDSPLRSGIIMCIIIECSVTRIILLTPDTHTVVFVLSCLFMAFVIYFLDCFYHFILMILATMSEDARSILIRFQYSSGVWFYAFCSRRVIVLLVRSVTAPMFFADMHWCL